jgi:hypothetical protein
MFAVLPPAVAIAVARPRLDTNHRTTVALQGTQEQHIPIGAMSPSPTKTIDKLEALAHTRYPDVSTTEPNATTLRGPTRSVNQPETADRAL